MKPSPLRLFLLLFIVLIGLDQAIKAWARQAGGNLDGHLIAPLIPGVFEFKLVFNYGIAFGLFQGRGQLFVPLALLMAVGAGYYVHRNPQEGKWVTWTAALLAAGAIGNLIDRVALGRVTDMFWFSLINFPVFNLADACISIAGTILVLRSLRDMLRPAERAAKVETDDTPIATPPQSHE